MPVLLIATEADEGMGHVVPWTNFVEQAVAQGYQVHMAAPDVGMLNQHIGERCPIQIWSSPRLRSPVQGKSAVPSAVKSWPELLVSLGYAQPLALQGAVKAWRSILERVQPCIVLADYAPALLLAAWTLDIPCLEVGVGFCVPPLAPRLQSFPGITRTDTAAIALADAQLTQAFNACLSRFGKAHIGTLTDIQAWPISRMVMSPPELDPYGPRPDVVHAGLLRPHTAEEHTDKVTDWPIVVGYLKANTPGLDQLLDTMEQASVHALIYVAGADQSDLRRHGTVELTNRPIDLHQAFNHSSVYLSNGGHAGIGHALQKGCWPVVVPQQLEQVAAARNLLQRGWGAMWLPGLHASTEDRVREMFSHRPRQPRVATDHFGEQALFQAIEAIQPGRTPYSGREP